LYDRLSERYGWHPDQISEMPMNQIEGYSEQIKKADEAEKKRLANIPKMPKVPRMKQIPRGRR